MSKYWFTFLLVSLVACHVHADVLTLKDGTRVDGEMKKTADGWVVTRPDGSTTEVKSSEVGSIELRAASAPADKKVEQAFASLKRSVENSTDPKQAIDRYRRFIEQYKTSPQAEEAKKEIATWQERIDKKLVKVHSDWLTPEQVADTKRKATDYAEQARQLIKQNQLSDADIVLQHVLVFDPNHPTSLYLRGVLLYRTEQLGQAKKHFEGVVQSLKDHGPTYNNLGVILFKQKRYPESLNAFSQAMAALPKNKAVLDNVAEALLAIPQNQRSGQAYQKAQRLFAEQDPQVQSEMARTGYFRSGSAWITKEERDLEISAQKELNERKAVMASKYDALLARLTRLRREMDDTERAMRRMEAARFVRDVNGQVSELALPPGYFQMRDDIERLKQDETAVQRDMEGMQAQAKELESKAPAQKIPRGSLQIIDVEGTPMLMLPSPAATTQPTTQPILK